MSGNLCTDVEVLCLGCQMWRGLSRDGDRVLSGSVCERVLLLLCYLGTWPGSSVRLLRRWVLSLQEAPWHMGFQGPWVRRETPLTLAIWSNLPKSSLSMSTSSLGEHSLASRVKPTMSAYSTLYRGSYVNGARAAAQGPSPPAGWLSSYLTPWCLLTYRL